MFKLALAIMASTLLVGGVKNVNTENTNSQTPKITAVRRANEVEDEQEWEEVSYVFEDEDGRMEITLISEELYQATIIAGETEATVKDKYVKEENILTLYLRGELLGKFKVLEDKSLERIEEDIEDMEDEETSQYSHMNLNELIDALKNELKESDINYKKVGAILLAMLGLFGSGIVGLLIAIIKLKLKNMKKDDIIDAVRKEADEKFAQYQDDVKELLNVLMDKVTKKIDDAEEKREKEAQAQNLRLKASIEQAKKNLSINNILNED